MKLRILYHGNCFDGVSSAAVFTKFYRATVDPNAEIAYTPTMHQANNAFDRAQLDGDQNAIVDFKYCPDERLTWWFDHHQSAFLSKEDEQHFSQRHVRQKVSRHGEQVVCGIYRPHRQRQVRL
jgi:oligoribonuclease NrnB/cAMP/cGMP phosphodiesterase (DHH superfamily)